MIPLIAGLFPIRLMQGLQLPTSSLRELLEDLRLRLSAPSWNQERLTYSDQDCFTFD